MSKAEKEVTLKLIDHLKEETARFANEKLANGESAVLLGRAVGAVLLTLVSKELEVESNT